MATWNAAIPLQHAEIKHDDRADEKFQDQQEFALREQIGLAGFVDQLGDFEHRLVHRQIAQVRVHRQAEDQAEHGYAQADHQESRAAHAVQEHSLTADPGA